MASLVVLPHGATLDLDTVSVIRSVGEKESDNFNERMAQRPGSTGAVSSRRWTIALETQGERGILTRYTAAEAGQPALSVKEFVARLGEAGRRFTLIDTAAAAIDSSARVTLIRPLAPRDGSTGRATIWVDGGSGNGLVVASSASHIKDELGRQAAHLNAVGSEGFIDATRIERISPFDPQKELEPGQTRFTTAVKFKGVGRPQYFQAHAHEITGSAVIDTRASAGSGPAPAAPSVPGTRRRSTTTSAPEVR